MIIACIDFSNNGHRFHLMLSAVKTIIEAGKTAVCITDDTGKIKKQIEASCPAYCNKVIYHNYKPIPPSGSTWNKDLHDILIALSYWRQYQKVVQKIEKTTGIKIDLVLFNYIDVFLSCKMPILLQKLFFHYAWAGLYIHPRYMRTAKDAGVQTKKSGISDIDYLLTSDNCIGIGIFDNGIINALQFRLDKKVTLIPDISDVSTDYKSYPLVNEIKAKAKDRIIIGSIGMSFYSGTVDLIKLAMANSEKEYFFVFCGSFDEESYEYIPAEEDKELLKNFRKNPLNNCFWKEGYLADEKEYNAVFNSLDIIYMMYPEHYTSSNRLTKAAYFNKFVLASNQHCVGENVVKYQLGEVAVPGNIDQQAEKIALLVSKITEKQFPVAQWETYYALNNEQMMQKQLRSLLNI